MLTICLIEIFLKRRKRSNGNWQNVYGEGGVCVVLNVGVDLLAGSAEEGILGREQSQGGDSVVRKTVTSGAEPAVGLQWGPGAEGLDSILSKERSCSEGV